MTQHPQSSSNIIQSHALRLPPSPPPPPNRHLPTETTKNTYSLHSVSRSLPVRTRLVRLVEPDPNFPTLEYLPCPYPVFRRQQLESSNFSPLSSSLLPPLPSLPPPASFSFSLHPVSSFFSFSSSSCCIYWCLFPSTEAPQSSHWLVFPQCLQWERGACKPVFLGVFTQLVKQVSRCFRFDNSFSTQIKAKSPN